MPEDKARKRAVRQRMADTGERYTTAARRLAASGADPVAEPGGGPRDDFTADRRADLDAGELGGLTDTDYYDATAQETARNDPAYTDLVKDDPELAEREWWLRARVRILSTYPGGRPGVWWNGDRPPQPGEELQMRQGGRAGRKVDRDAWWTSSDIDGAVIVPAEHVLVLEVTEVHAPTHKGAAMPAAEVVAMFGAPAAGWAEQGILVIPGLFDFEVRASSGELLGLIRRGGQGDTYNPPRPLEPVTYRAVIREGAEAWPAPPAVAFPDGFVPPDPARATVSERRRWYGQSVAYDRRSDREPGYYDPCDSCTCCTRGGCHRGEGSECGYSERLGDYTCPCTGG